jgi:hypothetical protein
MLRFVKDTDARSREVDYAFRFGFLCERELARPAQHTQIGDRTPGATR